jgi:hypothetical protein
MSSRCIIEEAFVEVTAASPQLPKESSNQREASLEERVVTETEGQPKATG